MIKDVSTLEPSYLHEPWVAIDRDPMHMFLCPPVRHVSFVCDIMCDLQVKAVLDVVEVVQPMYDGGKLHVPIQREPRLSTMEQQPAVITTKEEVETISVLPANRQMSTSRVEVVAGRMLGTCMGLSLRHGETYLQ